MNARVDPMLFRLAGLSHAGRDGLPAVSVHLVVSGTPSHVVRRTLDGLAALDHPALEVLVVDHNTVDPTLWEPVAEHCARLGGAFRFFHLGAAWPGGRAGALDFALAETAPAAGVIGVLGGDVVVDRGWLGRMLPCFGDAAVGMAQAQLERPETEHSAAGTDHLLLVRREALEAAGGWGAESARPDAALELMLMRHGWETASVAERLGRGTIAIDAMGHRRQAEAGALAVAQGLKRHGKIVFDPRARALTPVQRRSVLRHWLPVLGDAAALAVLVVALGWSAALILAPESVVLPVAAVGVPAVLVSALRLAMLLWQPRPASLGLALSHARGKALWRGLLPRWLAPRPSAAREEGAVLALLAVAALGTSLADAGAGWLGMLLLLALPYLAASVRTMLAELGDHPLPHGVARPRH